MRHSLNGRRVVGAIVAAALLAGPAAQAGTAFRSYDGWDKVQQGQGGVKRVVGDVDIWTQGSPPRRFKILGTVADDRPKGGLIGRLASTTLEIDVARRARDAGGDAAILTDARAASYLVVKYLPDSPDAAPAYQPPSQSVITVRY